MKRLTNIILTILLFIVLLFISNTVEATSISASPSTPQVGQSVTITVSVPNVNTVDLTATVSGAGTSGTIRLVDGSLTGEARTFSKSITVTPTSAGTINVSVSSSSNAVLNGQYVGVGASNSITVIEVPTNTGNPTGGSSGSSGNTSSNSGSASSTNNKPSTTTPKPEEKKSNDSKLTSLSVAEGVIAPEFSASVKEYTLSVPNEITAINVTAATSHSKAKYSVEGGIDLQVGDNVVKVIVKAEDGTTSTYTITVNRARAELALQSLTVSFADENGVITELPLTPLFSFDVYEYTMEKLSHTIKNLNIEALANLEGAIVKIEGNEDLKEGENKIIITITMPAETSPETGEVIREEEIKTYTITVEKEAEPIVVPPTFWEKVQNWFAGIGGWIGNNSSKIQTGSLMFCSVAMFALSIYLVIDYKKYKTLVAKLKQLTGMNSTNEPVSELTTIDENNNDVESTEIIQEENIEMNETKKKTGRHF
ncbi:MAG: cadherin-like beta sandwich domain-containing protein [Clostridiales bacterium]|nr:cadherin-like beta sandwich domain-containing protein [Clostridiales bacterium]